MSRCARLHWGEIDIANQKSDRIDAFIKGAKPGLEKLHTNEVAVLGYLSGKQNLLRTNDNLAPKLLAEYGDTHEQERIDDSASLTIGVLRGLSGPEREELYGDIAHAVSLIRKIDPPTGLATPESAPSLPMDTHDFAELTLGQEMLLTKIDKDSELRRCYEFTASGVRTNPVFIHGDFKADNLLVREGRLVSVVDWDRSGAGGTEADVSSLIASMYFYVALRAAASTAWRKVLQDELPLVAEMHISLQRDIEMSYFSLGSSLDRHITHYLLLRIWKYTGTVYTWDRAARIALGTAKLTNVSLKSWQTPLT